MTTAQKKLGLVVRVSRVGKRGGERFQSPGDQVAIGTARAEREGYAVRVFDADAQNGGVSGATPYDDRPGMGAALRLVENGKLAGIVVAAMDRLVREDPEKGVTLRGFQQRIRKAGGVLLVADNAMAEVLDPADDELMGNEEWGVEAQNVANRIYRREAKKRWRRAQLNAGGRGVHVAPTPTGYARAEDGKLIIGPHAETVRTLFKRRARGESLADLTRWFNAEGVPSRSGKPWSGEGVRQILRNRCYLGEARAAGTTFAGAHEPLVDLPTYLACEALLGTRQAPGRGGDGPLLGGLIRCTCGSRMSRTSTSVGGKRYAFYICKGNTQCKANKTAATVAASLIEPLVTEYALALLGGVQYSRSADGGKTAAQLQAAVEAADAEIAAFLTAVPATTPGYADALAQKTAVKDEALAALAGTASETERVYIEAAQVAADFEAMTVAEQRRILGAIVDRITVQRGRGPVENRVRVTFKGYDPELISYGNLEEAA